MSEMPPAGPAVLFRSSRPRPIPYTGDRHRLPLLLSLFAHLALLPLLLPLRPEPLPPSGEQGLSVEVVSVQDAPPPAAPERPASPTASAPPANKPPEAAERPVASKETETGGQTTDPPSAPPKQPPAEASTGRPADLLPAKRLFSAAVLKDPRSWKAVKALKALSPDDQIEQLCNIEAMEQIRRHDRRRRPDFVISYALAPPNLQAPLFVADGAAFHDRNQWIGLRYRCVVTPDRRDVVEFAFAIGANIARDEWTSLSLPTEEDGSD